MARLRDLLQKTAEIVFPNTTIRSNKALTSPTLLVPVGAHDLQIEIDGSAWDPTSLVTLELYAAQDGINFYLDQRITANKASLIVEDSKCSAGIYFPLTNQSPLFSVYGVLSVTGPSIVLVGKMNCS